MPAHMVGDMVRDMFGIWSRHVLDMVRIWSGYGENVWDYLRGNCLSHCVWDTYEDILDACCDAWNDLMAKSHVITSIGTRDWAQVKI